MRANVGDLRRTDDGAVIHVRGKGDKDRRIPIEPAMVQILERYLDSRAARFPAKRRSSPGGGLTAWPTAAPPYTGCERPAKWAMIASTASSPVSSPRPILSVTSRVNGSNS